MSHPAHAVKGHGFSPEVPTVLQKEVPCKGCQVTIDDRSLRYKCVVKDCNTMLHVCCADMWADKQVKFVEFKDGSRCGFCSGKMKTGYAYGGAGVFLHPCCAVKRSAGEPVNGKCKCHNPNGHKLERKLPEGKQWDHKNYGLRP